MVAAINAQLDGNNRAATTPPNAPGPRRSEREFEGDEQQASPRRTRAQKLANIAFNSLDPSETNQ
jgi:hypothetical protein